ncbi:MAG: TonB family protein [Sphingomonadaceae bacterium]|nr:TonB family protein [Sphingomonadaceae bacterium]
MRMTMMQAAGNGTVSGYRSGGRSPIGIGGAVAVHALVIGAWLLIPKEMITQVISRPFETYAVPEDKAPPPDPVEQTTEQPIKTRQAEQTPTVTDPIVPLTQGDPIVTGKIDEGQGIDPGPTIVIRPIDPPHVPVLVDPTIDPRAMGTFQPEYPGAMIRQGMDGVVTVRVTISAEGRVTDIEKLSATDDSFWLATQRHALRKWRFRAATRDGVAVASVKVLTVRFTLTER